MLDAIANLALLILGAATVLVWIISLVQWDGKNCEPNEQDCDHCSFPCENHDKKEYFGGNKQ